MFGMLYANPSRRESQLVQSFLCLKDASSHPRPSGVFREFASEVLQSVQLHAFGDSFRLLEIEFYLFSDSHPDPFTHCHGIQQEFGVWYLHRVGQGFRGGSFKGIDFTFGGDESFGGVLIRSIVDADGSTTCGPSLCVDRLLSASGCEKAAELDAMIGGKKIWDPNSPIRFVQSDPIDQTVFACPRVGLSGTKIEDKQQVADYGERDYRFYVQPKLIKKGRPEMIRGMHRAGYSIDEIRALTGSPKKSIEKHTGNCV